MSLQDWLTIYFAGAVLTAINVSKLTHFYRCVLLWPVFWLYVIWLVVSVAIDDFRTK